MPSPTPAVLLELAATQSGFDLRPEAPAPWHAFASTQCPLRVWLRPLPEGPVVVALSMRSVGAALAAESLGGTAPSDVALPGGALMARAAPDRPALQRILRRAWQLARTLPDSPLRAFEARVVTLPRATEAERLVVQRVGQDVFREALIDYWEGRCAVTGLAVTALLRASHIKPWAACATDAERLDVFNGLLLAPHLDAAFDQGFVTVADDGALVCSVALDGAARTTLGLVTAAQIARLDDRHRAYLAYHRAKVFERWRAL